MAFFNTILENYSDDIQVMVVIAIIAILASMLLPALNAARDKAHGISCISKLKQMGQASSSYSMDARDFIVPAAYGVKDDNVYTWRTSMAPYLGFQDLATPRKSADTKVYPKIFECPGIKSDRYKELGYHDFYGIYGGYGINVSEDVYQDIIAGYFNTQYTTGKLSKLKHISDIFLLSEGYCVMNRRNLQAVVNYTYLTTVQLPNPHSSGRNILYLDGHASWLKGYMPTFSWSSTFAKRFYMGKD